MVARKYPNLFSPIKIGPLTLKNRIVSAPTSLADLSPSLSGLGESRVYHLHWTMWFSYSWGLCDPHVTSQRPSGSSVWALLPRS